MTDRPIIFSAPMIRALIDGRKTQTRRVLKDTETREPYVADGVVLWDHPDGPVYRWERVPAVGDRLWVREAYAFGWPVNPGERLPRDEGPDHAVTYRADGQAPFGGGKWHPSIHMPRWASRLTLVVTDVRVQRLQDISEADARAEGVSGSAGGTWGCEGLIEDYSDLWNSIYGPDAWDANPWVAALTFDVHRCNIDQMYEVA